MANYILSIDQGTTSSRAMLFTRDGDIAHVAQQTFPQQYPKDGWVEHDPEAIWDTVLHTCQEALENLSANNDCVIGIGITNQRETTLVWEKSTGKPIYNAIVWQDRRTFGFCNELKRKGHEQKITDKTGLLLDPYFSASKIRWILDNVPGAREKAERGELAFGTVDSFLLWRLTGGNSHQTDITNGSRTSLFNIHTEQWDEELLELFDVPKAMLPEVKDCAADFGRTQPELFGKSIPILAIAGDQQAALIGQCCFDKGQVKSTYGTGCFMVVNTGTQALVSKNRLLTTIGYRINGETHYSLEGSIFMAGAAVQWLRDGMKFFESASESEAIAQEVGYQKDVVVVPAFTGLGAPYWNPEARGAILGLTRNSGIPHIVAATLQAVCYQTRDLLTAMQNDGQMPTELRVDGGLSINNWAMQCLADMLALPVDRPQNVETTALGVANLVALQAGCFSSLEELKIKRKSNLVFKPQIDECERDEFYSSWLNAVKKVQS